MAIAQDLLSTQYLRYNTEYSSKITYFTEDYEVFKNTQDKKLKYYNDIIESSMGLLALKNGEGLFLENSDEKLNIHAWDDSFSFTENGDYCLPVNYEYTAEDREENVFSMLGSAVGLGFYSFTNDVEKLLYEHDDRDVWDDYCKYQEVVFGIGSQYCGWLDRMTASQALERLYKHLNAKTEVVYGDGSIDITTDADSYWMILKGKAKEISVTGGTAKEIGNRCWLIEVTGGTAEITLK